MILPAIQAPGNEVSVTGSLEGWDSIILLVCLAVTVCVLLWPLIRAVARRIEAGASMTEARDDLDELRDRMRQLEERVDFAERLLAQARQPARLGAPTEESSR